jgi:prepilin-type N-terminal cleavage/methylation domain-containing protein
MSFLPFASPSCARRRAGFTLIELLVVIAIIGILASILIPTVAHVKERANKAKTKAQFSQIITAMEGFKQEYGYYPSIAKDGKLDGESFAYALMAKKNLAGEAAATNATSTILMGNVKRIAFYTPANDDVSTQTKAEGELVDAFGNTEFIVRVDTNGDGRIDDKDSRSDSNGRKVYLALWSEVKGVSDTTLKVDEYDTTLTVTPPRVSVAIYTAGKGDTAADIVASWK